MIDCCYFETQKDTNYTFVFFCVALCWLIICGFESNMTEFPLLCTVLRKEHLYTVCRDNTSLFPLGKWLSAKLFTHSSCWNGSQTFCCLHACWNKTHSFHQKWWSNAMIVWVSFSVLQTVDKDQCQASWNNIYFQSEHSSAMKLSCIQSDWMQSRLFVLIYCCLCRFQLTFLRKNNTFVKIPDRVYVCVCVRVCFCFRNERSHTWTRMGHGTSLCIYRRCHHCHAGALSVFGDNDQSVSTYAYTQQLIHPQWDVKFI